MFRRSDQDTTTRADLRRRRAVAAREGDTVSAALLASGRDMRRATAVSGAARLPYCMMGVCFDCLVTIDGVGNRQGCLVPLPRACRSRSRRASGRSDDDHGTRIATATMSW